VRKREARYGSLGWQIARLFHSGTLFSTRDGSFSHFLQAGSHAACQYAQGSSFTVQTSAQFIQISHFLAVVIRVDFICVLPEKGIHIPKVSNTTLIDAKLTT